RRDRAGRVPQRARVDQGPERVRLGTDIRLPDQRRRESLQLAQLPLGGRVDRLYRARDLDIDLDSRFVHQLEPAQTGRGVSACAERRLLVRELLLHTAAQCVDETALVGRGL